MTTQNPSEDVVTQEAIGLVGNMRRMAGYAYGLSQPCVVARIRVLPVPGDRLALVEELLRARFPMGPDDAPDPLLEVDETGRALLGWVRRMLNACANPVLEPARTENLPASVLSVLQPCLSHDACMRALRLCVDLLRWVAEAPAPTGDALAEQFGPRIDQDRRRLEGRGVSGFNAIHFLRAARALELPWMQLPSQVFQIGYGSAAQLLNSSISGQTSNIAVGWARSKPKAARLMRLAGLPVPKHALAASVAQAVRIADALGYPVVVKPADQDGGVGVSAGLRDAAAVERAYANAAEHSSSILIEKHFEGRDYRVHVVHGEVQGILDRVPGSVVGDGVHDVRTLIERQNEERRTATDDRRHLHPIAIDDEAVGLLADLSMTLESVPEAGRAIRLRAAANVASGGVPVPMPPAEAHPDNLRLAARAARVLGLDVAGIDLLIPDIRRSWFETGAAICEVNAQPQMFTTMHLPTLRSLIGPRGGRIPVVVLIEPRAPSGDAAVSTQVHDLLRARMPATALVASRGVWLGDAQVFGPPEDLFDAARALLVDRGVDALVIEVSGRDMLRHGWPVDRCDVLALLDDPINPAGPSDRVFVQNTAFARWLRPTRVVVGTGNARVVARARRTFGARVVEVDGNDASGFARSVVAGCALPGALPDQPPSDLL